MIVMTHQNYKIADTTAPLDFFKKQGYYVVGNEIYNHKFNALATATRTKQPVTWNFNDEIFENISWRKPVNVDLKELYRMRAQQLRDQYDYITVMCSGGSDSSTVIKSFLDNGIHLDEVCHDRPFKHMAGKYVPNKNRSAENLISEWDFATKPFLEEIEKNHPRTKITLLDSTESFELEDFEDTCTQHLGHNYVILKRHRAVDNHVAEISKKYPRNVIVMAVDKPCFYINNRTFCVFFSDNLCCWKSDYTNRYNRAIEYFYWTPDLPEIIVKQAQLIYQKFLVNPNLEHLMNNDHSRGFREFTTEILYPDYHARNYFQADKSPSTIFSKHYQWATGQINHVAIQSWLSSLKNQWSLIDPEYFNRDKTTQQLIGYKLIHHRRQYPIGKLPNYPIT